MSITLVDRHSMCLLGHALSNYYYAGYGMGEIMQVGNGYYYNATARCLQPNGAQPWGGKTSNSIKLDIRPRTGLSRRPSITSVLVSKPGLSSGVGHGHQKNNRWLGLCSSSRPVFDGTCG